MFADGQYSYQACSCNGSWGTNSNRRDSLFKCNFKVAHSAIYLLHRATETVLESMNATWGVFRNGVFLNSPFFDHLLKLPVALLQLWQLHAVGPGAPLWGPDRHVVDMHRLSQTCWLTLAHGELPQSSSNYRMKRIKVSSLVCRIWTNDLLVIG